MNKKQELVDKQVKEYECLRVDTSRAKSVGVSELDNTKNNPDWEALCKLKGWDK